jgi:DNA-binding response OmpR family regulator
MNIEPQMGGELRQPIKPARNRVLIIDDDMSVRAAIVGVLQGAGYQVFQSGDGREALSQFDPRQLDLLLLDLGLPNQSGWDTFEGFTRKNPLLQVIIITGQSRQAEMAMAAGVGALMEKPLGAAELLQTMHELLTEPEDARLRRLCGQKGDGRYVSRYIRPGPNRLSSILPQQH